MSTRSTRTRRQVDYAAIEENILSSGTNILANPGSRQFVDAIESKLASLPDSEGRIDVVSSKNFNLQWLKDQELKRPVLIQGLAGLGAKIPCPGFMVRDVGNILGREWPLDVMDVSAQDELPGQWTIGDWVDYYETPASLRTKILNVISLEFSGSPLSPFVRAPAVIRQIDWIDNIWPGFRRSIGEYPAIQKYCLMSVAGSWTDFHIDFGGSSVWYHVHTGIKEFIFLPPTPDNIRDYEQWTTSPAQSRTFFSDLVAERSKLVPCSDTPGMYKLPGHREAFVITLTAGNTMLIPAGWIHAVYTPVDSLVFGGNFLHGLNIQKQLSIYEMEIYTKIPRIYRFPFFEQLHWYAAGYYLQLFQRPEFKQVYLYALEHKLIPRPSARVLNHWRAMCGVKTKETEHRKAEQKANLSTQSSASTVPPLISTPVISPPPPPLFGAPPLGTGSSIAAQLLRSRNPSQKPPAVPVPLPPPPPPPLFGDEFAHSVTVPSVMAVGMTTGTDVVPDTMRALESSPAGALNAPVEPLSTISREQFDACMAKLNLSIGELRGMPYLFTILCLLRKGMGNDESREGEEQASGTTSASDEVGADESSDHITRTGERISMEKKGARVKGSVRVQHATNQVAQDSTTSLASTSASDKKKTTVKSVYALGESEYSLFPPSKAAREAFAMTAPSSSEELLHPTLFSSGADNLLYNILYYMDFEESEYYTPKYKDKPSSVDSNTLEKRKLATPEPLITAFNSFDASSNVGVQDSTPSYPIWTWRKTDFVPHLGVTRNAHGASHNRNELEEFFVDVSKPISTDAAVIKAIRQECPLEPVPVNPFALNTSAMPMEDRTEESMAAATSARLGRGFPVDDTFRDIPLTKYNELIFPSYLDLSLDSAKQLPDWEVRYAKRYCRFGIYGGTLPSFHEEAPIEHTAQYSVQLRNEQLVKSGITPSNSESALNTDSSPRRNMHDKASNEDAVRTVRMLTKAGSKRSKLRKKEDDEDWMEDFSDADEDDHVIEGEDPVAAASTNAPTMQDTADTKQSSGDGDYEDDDEDDIPVVSRRGKFGAAKPEATSTPTAPSAPRASSDASTSAIVPGMLPSKIFTKKLAAETAGSKRKLPGDAQIVPEKIDDLVKPSGPVLKLKRSGAAAPSSAGMPPFPPPTAPPSGPGSSNKKFTLPVIEPERKVVIDFGLNGTLPGVAPVLSNVDDDLFDKEEEPMSPRISQVAPTGNRATVTNPTFNTIPSVVSQEAGFMLRMRVQDSNAYLLDKGLQVPPKLGPRPSKVNRRFAVVPAKDKKEKQKSQGESKKRRKRSFESDEESDWSESDEDEALVPPGKGTGRSHRQEAEDELRDLLGEGVEYRDVSDEEESDGGDGDSELSGGADGVIYSEDEDEYAGEDDNDFVHPRPKRTRKAPTITIGSGTTVYDVDSAGYSFSAPTYTGQGGTHTVESLFGTEDTNGNGSVAATTIAATAPVNPFAPPPPPPLDEPYAVDHVPVHTPTPAAPATKLRFGQSFASRPSSTTVSSLPTHAVTAASGITQIPPPPPSAPSLPASTPALGLGLGLGLNLSLGPVTPQVASAYSASNAANMVSPIVPSVQTIQFSTSKGTSTSVQSETRYQAPVDYPSSDDGVVDVTSAASRGALGSQRNPYAAGQYDTESGRFDGVQDIVSSRSNVQQALGQGRGQKPAESGAGAGASAPKPPKDPLKGLQGAARLRAAMRMARRR